jgi:hypothetical protein
MAEKESVKDLLNSIRPEDEDEDETEVEEADEAAEPVDEPDPDDEEEEGAAKAKADGGTKDHNEEFFSRRRQRELKTANLDRENQELKERLARLEGRLDGQPKTAAETKVEEKNPYDEDDEPLAHMKWERQRTEKEVADLREQIAQGHKARETYQQEEQQEKLVQEYAAEVQTDLQRTLNEAPGLLKVLEPYGQAVVQHFVGMGMSHQAAQREAMLSHLRVANQAKAQNIGPAEALYRHAVTIMPHLGEVSLTAGGSAQGGQKPDMAAARAAAKKAPRAIGARGGQGQARSLNTLAKKRDKEWQKGDVDLMFDQMRQQMGGGR